MYVITANATEDGRPIWMGRDGAWSRELASVAPIDDDDTRESWVARAKAQQATACDPYIIEVTRDNDRTAPLGLRERIRAEGPTVLAATSLTPPANTSHAPK